MRDPVAEDLKRAVAAEVQRLIDDDEPLEAIEERALANVYAARKAAIAKRIKEAAT